MFQKIVVAYDGSPESHRSLVSAIQLAKSLDAELHTVTVMGESPAYTAFASVADSAAPRMLEHDREQFYQGLHQRELHISRLWSTVYELAQDAPCSVLGVH